MLDPGKFVEVGRTRSMRRGRAGPRGHSSQSGCLGGATANSCPGPGDRGLRGARDLVSCYTKELHIDGE